MPALVVARGRHVPAAEGLQTTAAAMRAEFLALDDVGHRPMWEAPDATGTALDTARKASARAATKAAVRGRGTARWMQKADARYLGILDFGSPEVMP